MEDEDEDDEIDTRCLRTRTTFHLLDPNPYLGASDYADPCGLGSKTLDIVNFKICMSLQSMTM